MGYIIDHKTIKYGTYISPCFKTNVDQYIKPLTNFKNAQGSPKKRAKTQRYRYSASLLSNKKRRKNHNPKSGFSGSFCYSLAKSNVFAPLTSLRDVQRKTLLRRAGLHPFFGPSRSKKFTAFSAHKSGLEKIGANNAPKKLPPAIFACPSFANKIISALLKLSAKNGLRPSHESACDLSANRADKKERDNNSLPVLTRLLL